MAKEDYLEGYGQGLKRGKENPITGPINKELDKALGNPHGSAKRGVDQGYDEMKEAIKLEEKRKRMKVLPAQLTDNPVRFKKESERTAEEKAMMSEYEKPAPYKKGGVVKDLKKAGFYDAKKDKAKRLSIINKVTTKPERIEMVDKMFSAKKMAKGGTASSRADGCAVRGKTRA
jgi:uncharacterized protein YktA (UPF0223 family)